MRRRPTISWLTLLLLATLFLWCVSVSFLKSGVPCAAPGPTPETPDLFSPAPVKHVTKSLTELGKMDEMNAHVLFFNHVPKCGSEVIVLLLQWLQGWNNFRHVRLKGGMMRKLNRLGQEQFVSEVYEIIRNEAVPLSFDRHLYFVNFTEFDRQSPTFVNLIRNPVDRVVYRFYFEYVKRYSPLQTKKLTNKYVMEAFRDCIRHKERGCYFRNGESYDLSIPYFCGQDDRCRLHNSKWALQMAKRNVDRYFPVVGVLEELNTTLEVLEEKIPYFFKGVQTLYYKDLLQPHRKKNKRKLNITKDISIYLKAVLKTEWQFYEWIKSRLFQQLQMMYGYHNAH